MRLRESALLEKKLEQGAPGGEVGRLQLENEGDALGNDHPVKAVRRSGSRGDLRSSSGLTGAWGGVEEPGGGVVDAGGAEGGRGGVEGGGEAAAESGREVGGLHHGSRGQRRWKRGRLSEPSV